ncbi:WG repeat-containing protein [Psychrobacter sp. DM4]|uniref:WG repeat-containing protein n=1 Tax=Psychrobacter sp. DM4 TaxID=3440637 RepID=UPI003F504A82
MVIENRQVSYQRVIKLAGLVVSKLFISAGTILSLTLLIPTAQAATCKVPKSFYKHVSCTANSRYFLAVKDFGAPVALLDKNGKKVADLMEYQRVDATKISGGLMPVQRNSKVGYVDMRGREVIPTRYDIVGSNQEWARAVSDGRIVVKRNGNFGVITPSNQVVVPFTSSISNIDNYKNGIARVNKNKAVSWLSKDGNPVQDPTAKSERQASSSQSDKDNPTTTAASSVPAPPASFSTLKAKQQEGKWGFVDDNDVVMITYSFDDVRPFSEGLAAVSIDNKWGFLNLGGKLVIPFNFENNAATASDTYQGVSAFVFKEGIAWVGTLANGQKTCIDKRGEIVGCS